MRRLITVPYYPVAPVVLPSLNAATLTATPVSSSSITLTVSYAGPPSAVSYTFWQWDAGHSAWVVLVTQAGAAYAVNGLTAGVTYQFMAVANTNETPSRASGPGFATSGTGAGAVRWAPGHYMRSNEVDRSASGQITNKRAEQTVLLASGANVLGWAGNYTWALLDKGKMTASLASNGVLTVSALGTVPSLAVGNVVGWSGFTSSVQISSQLTGGAGSTGTYQTNYGGAAVGSQSFHAYDFSHIDADITACSPKSVIIQVQGSFGGGSMPTWITGDASYGSSPNNGSYGYWNGPQGNPTYVVVAYWRSVVMNEWILLMQALGYYYNANTAVQGVIDGNDTSFGLANGSDYSIAGYRTQFDALGTAAVAAMPNMNWGQKHSFIEQGNIQNSADFVQDAYVRRVAFAGPDILGYSFMLSNPRYYWAQAAYCGIAGTTPGTNYKTHMASLHNVESPELNGSGLTGSPYTPNDIFAWANVTVGINYLIWNYIGGTGAGNWTGGTNSVLACINANPVTNLSYPSSYP